MKKYIVPIIIIIVIILLVVLLTSASAKAADNEPGGNGIKVIDADNKVKYFAPQKYEVWKQIQDYIGRILTSPDWASWRNLDSFRALTNGGKIDAVHEQVAKNTDLYQRGYP